ADRLRVRLAVVHAAAHVGIERQVEHAQQEAAPWQLGHRHVLQAEVLARRQPLGPGRKHDLLDRGLTHGALPTTRSASFDAREAQARRAVDSNGSRSGRQANLVSINSALPAPACSTRRAARARSIYIHRRRAGTLTPRLRARRTSPCRRRREYWACG